MPSSSQKQHNLMAMVAHDPAAAKRLGIPQSVGKEFTSADKGRKFSKGGFMKETMGPRGMGKDVEKGSNKLTKFGESAVQKRGHTKGKNLGDTGKTEPIQKEKKYAKGGVVSGGIKKFGEHTIQRKGHTRGKNV